MVGTWCLVPHTWSLMLAACNLLWDTWCLMLDAWMFDARCLMPRPGLGPGPLPGRSGQDAGVGACMLRGAWDSLTGKWKGFWVSWSLVCFWFLGFLVSWFLGFKNLLCFQKIFVTYYPISITCFLIDIDSVSKMFKNLLDGSSSFFGACLFHIFQSFGFTKHWDS